MVDEITTKEELEKVLDESSLVLLDFWAPWCGPCKMLTPVIEELSEEYDDVKFLKVNVDDAQDLAAEFSIMSIPTLVLYKDKEVVEQEQGALSKEQLKSFIDTNK